MEDVSDLISEFHIVVNNLHLYDEWIRYRENYIQNLAEQWYRDNEIHRYK